MSFSLVGRGKGKHIFAFYLFVVPSITRDFPSKCFAISIHIYIFFVPFACNTEEGQNKRNILSVLLQVILIGGG